MATLIWVEYPRILRYTIVTSLFLIQSNLFVVVVFCSGNIYDHIRMGTDCAHADVIVLPHWENQVTSTMP